MNAVPTVRDIMIESAISFDPDMSAFEAMDTMIAKKLSGVAVIDKDDKLVGFLTEKDCLRLVAISHLYNMTGRRVGDIMSGIYQGLHPDMDILSASMTFLNCNFATLPVLDGDDLVGSITRMNMLETLQKFFRERGARHENNRVAQNMVNNPSSIDQFQMLVGQSNNAQLAAVFARRLTEKQD